MNRAKDDDLDAWKAIILALAIIATATASVRFLFFADYTHQTRMEQAE